jgi:hypothetical protein
MAPQSGANATFGKTVLQGQGQVALVTSRAAEAPQSRPDYRERSLFPAYTRTRTHNPKICIKHRLDSLDRSLQGGDLACWSQMAETQCELHRAETDLCNYIYQSILYPSAC